MIPKKRPPAEDSPAQQVDGGSSLFSLAWQIGRYSVVSLLFALTAYLIFIALVQVHALNPTYAILLSQLCVLPFAFMSSRKRVFKSNAAVFRNFALYIVGYLSSMLFQWLNVFAFHSWLKFPPYAVAAWGILISFPLFFFYQKLIFDKPGANWKKPVGMF